MIDMHCHILNNIDDGSRSFSQSIEMAKKASDLGYTKIFATPHYIKDSLEPNKEDINLKIDELNKTLLKEGINLLIYVGNEVYFTDDVLEVISDKKIYTLGNSKYVLIEFPLNGNIINLDNIMYSIIANGYIPIIAHPERYEFVKNDIESLKPLIEDGALLQINVASITGYYGKHAKKTVKKLLKNNMITFIGTDAHNENNIYDIYPKALKKIEKIIKKEKLDKILYTNPQYVLENKNIE